jgi:virulence-associated protein VagC
LLSVVRSGTSSTLGVSSHVEFDLADSVEAHASVSERIIYPWQEQFDDRWSQNSFLGETDCSCQQQRRAFSSFSTILYRRQRHVVLEEGEDELRRWTAEISSGMGLLEDALGFEVDVDEEDFISRGDFSANSRWNPNPGPKFGLSETGSSNFKLQFSNPSTNECFDCLYLKVDLERRR